MYPWLYPWHLDCYRLEQSPPRSCSVGSAWGPLRTYDKLSGIPGLSLIDRIKIRDANATMYFTASIIGQANMLQVLCYLENPAGSMLWAVRPIARLCSNTPVPACVTFVSLVLDDGKGLASRFGVLKSAKRSTEHATGEAVCAVSPKSLT